MKTTTKLKNYKSEGPCVACGYNYPDSQCYHHLKSRGSRGSDEPHNLISLCQKCHNLIHAIGTDNMANRFLAVKQWLLNNGWEYSGYKGKWIHEVKIKESI